MVKVISAAISAGVGYLSELQEARGYWTDYRLPAGESDAWVTAYVGLALADAGALGLSDEAARCALKAADWLNRVRHYPAGWGFNAQTGPDADATAYAILLLQAVKIRVGAEDAAWLRARWQSGGGFTMFETPGSVEAPHPDVTPVAFRALSPAERGALGPATLDYLQRSRVSESRWPSYRWRSSHYSTWHNGALMRRLDPRWRPGPPEVDEDGPDAVCSAFDLAFVAGIATLHAGPQAAWPLAAQLAALQQSDGSWRGGANLRCSGDETNTRSGGDLYVDLRASITTASVIRILGRLV